VCILHFIAPVLQKLPGIATILTSWFMSFHYKYEYQAEAAGAFEMFVTTCHTA
jgi:hypothetical protein